jgi:hypothetical protein
VSVAISINVEILRSNRVATLWPINRPALIVSKVDRHDLVVIGAITICIVWKLKFLITSKQEEVMGPGAIGAEMSEQACASYEQ